MVGLILNIVFVVAYILFVNYVIKKRKSIDNTHNFDILTSYPKVLFNVGIVILSITLVIHFVSLVLYFINEFEGMWVTFGIGVFFGILDMMLFYDLLLDYEAAKGDYLYISRFFKVKEIYVYDIVKIIYIRQMIKFYNKEGKCLFFMDINSLGVSDIKAHIIKKLNQYNRNLIIIDNNKTMNTSSNYVSNAKEIYTKIGEEYRIKTNKNIKLLTVLFVISIIALLIVIIFFHNSDSKLLIALGIILLIAIISFYNLRKKSLKELNSKDLELGKKYYYLNKKVVGSGHYRYNHVSGTLITLCVMFNLFGILLGVICITDVDPVKNELELVTGKVQYTAYKKVSKTYNIIIGLEETNSEYRIFGTALDAMDKDEFFAEIEIGETIYLYVDKDYREDEGRVDKNKDSWTYAYDISTDKQHYLTFENYLIYEEQDDNLGAGISITLGVLGIASLIYFFVYKNSIKNDIKNETISVYIN